MACSDTYPRPAARSNTGGCSSWSQSDGHRRNPTPTRTACHRGFWGKQLRIHSLTPTMKQRNKQINLQTSKERFFHGKFSNYRQGYSLPVALSRKYQKLSKKFNSYLVHPSIPSLWNDAQTELGTTRSRGVCIPLNVTAGGSFVPSAETPRVTMKLRFSTPHDFTVRFPLNSSKRVDGSSKCILVSSILKILDKG